MKITQEKYAEVVKHLLRAPATTKELAETTKLHLVTVQNLMRTFTQHGVVYVLYYEKDSIGRANTPVYQLARGLNG